MEDLSTVIGFLKIIIGIQILIMVIPIIKFFFSKKSDDISNAREWVCNLYYKRGYSLKDIVIILRRHEDDSEFDKTAWTCITELSRREKKEKELDDFIKIGDGFKF